MRGYGLSVFSGSKIEKFDVEVISVLRNFNPRQEVILIRAQGCNLEHTGAIAGMSGSPIYLQDESGKYRMVGAFAYGWPLMKDPLAGVQPIEYMLEIPLYEQKPEPQVPAPELASNWSVVEAIGTFQQRMASQFSASSPPPAGPMQLTPLATPLAVSGISGQSMSQLASLLKPWGMMPLQAGGGSAAEDAGDLKPGSVMAIPLLTGDLAMTAVGTCTEVIDGRVYGFGHPFTGEGPALLPLCSGEVNGVIANFVTSFKLATASKPLGTLMADQLPGVAGLLGKAPPTAPIAVRVRYDDGSLDRTYRFQAAIHPQISPVLTASAVFSSLSASRQLPHFNTVDYRLKITFSDGHAVRQANLLTNVSPERLFMELASPIAAAADNPFSRVLVQSVEGEFEIHEGAREAELLHVAAARRSYRPGETVRLFATVRPFRSVEVVQPLSFELPKELPEGDYPLVVSDLSQFVTDEHTASPFRFTAGSADEVFSALNELSALRSDAFYMRLSRPNPAVAVGRTSLPNLPASHRQLLLASGRSDVTGYIPSAVKQVQAPWVISGTAAMTVSVRNQQQ